MEADKKLATLEEEIKLMKGELKNSLASVRDYLLNMELPSSEFATVLAALGGDSSGTQKITIDGNIGNAKAAEASQPSEEGSEEPTTEETVEEFLEPESELSPEEEDLNTPEEHIESESEFAPEDELINQDENFAPEPGLPPEEEPAKPDEPYESLMPDSELPVQEELPMERERITAEVSQSTPKVNLLANLINWVARAKRVIGDEQMPTFLEVYGISGHLSPELKEAILHLSEITSEKPEDTNKAEIWSEAMLSLHGILTGGDAPLNPLKPTWNDDANEIQPEEDEVIETVVNKRKDTPVKLKLVFPDDDGKEKEFCIDLTPETGNDA